MKENINKVVENSEILSNVESKTLNMSLYAKNFEN
jgi:hypothetical protein